MHLRTIRQGFEAELAIVKNLFFIYFSRRPVPEVRREVGGGVNDLHCCATHSQGV